MLKHKSLNCVAPVAVGLSRIEFGWDVNKDNYVKVEFPYKESGFKIECKLYIKYQCQINNIMD